MSGDVPYPNWFAQYADRFFARHLAAYAGRSALRFLQIGAYTGDATTWLFENVLTADNAILTDVDTWRGSDDAPGYEQIDMGHVERIYDDRTALVRASGRLIKYKGTSESFFDSQPAGEFDFIYIDGDHTSYGVLNDAVRAYPLLRAGGLLAFDDYMWSSGKGRLFDPAPAIDSVADVYANRLEKLEIGLQAWFRKTA